MRWVFATICIIVMQACFFTCQGYPSDVGSPPRVHGRPGRVRRVLQGDPLRLRCPVVGSRPFRVEWFKDEERVDPDTWDLHSLSGRDDRVLRVRRVGAEAAGIYTCKGVNGFGSESFDFSVVVAGEDEGGGGGRRGGGGPTELLRSSLRDASVAAGSDFSLSCSVRNPARDAEMRWLKREKEEVGGENKRNAAALAAAAATAAKDVVKLEDGFSYRLLRSSKRIQMSDRWNPPPRRRLSDSSEDEQNSVADAKDPIRHFQMSVSSAAAADSGVYVCLVVNSLVDLDKTFRYNSAVVTVSGRETALLSSSSSFGSSTFSSSSTSSSSDDSVSGMSGLTVAVIVLPVVTVALAGVLFLVARGGSKGGDQKKTPGSVGGGDHEEEEGGGGGLRGGCGAILDTSRDASSSMALLQTSHSFTGRSFPATAAAAVTADAAARTEKNGSSSSTASSTGSSQGTVVQQHPPSQQQEQQQQQRARQPTANSKQRGSNPTLSVILERPRFYQLPGSSRHARQVTGGGTNSHGEQGQANQRFAGISRTTRASHQSSPRQDGRTKRRISNSKRSSSSNDVNTRQHQQTPPLSQHHHQHKEGDSQTPPRPFTRFRHDFSDDDNHHRLQQPPQSLIQSPYHVQRQRSLKSRPDGTSSSSSNPFLEGDETRSSVLSPPPPPPAPPPSMFEPPDEN